MQEPFFAVCDEMHALCSECEFPPWESERLLRQGTFETLPPQREWGPTDMVAVREALAHVDPPPEYFLAAEDPLVAEGMPVPCRGVGLWAGCSLPSSFIVHPPSIPSAPCSAGGGGGGGGGPERAGCAWRPPA